MKIEGRYLDEVMRKLYDELSKSTDTFQAGKGNGHDLLGQKVILKDPRARISATVTRGMLISALAEFCWYMSGSTDLDFIRFYIRDYPPPEATGALEEAYAQRSPKRLILIDGEELTRLLIHHGVGVRTHRELQLKRLDIGYFDDLGS